MEISYGADNILSAIYNISTMISWRGRQQLKYFSLLLGVAFVALGTGVFFFLNRPGSCFDGKKNDDELGVDCGGSCARLCPFEVSDVITHWARAFSSRAGTYDAVAFLENPNIGAGVREFRYVFKLYDAHNILTGEREGTTFLNPKDRFAVYEDGIVVGTGTNAPQRTFFEIQEDLLWESVSVPREVEYITRETVFEEARDGTMPKIKTTLVSRATGDARDLEVVALLFDDEENLIDAAKTEVPRLAAGETKSITFLLSSALREAPKRIDIFPRRNMVK